MKQPAYRYMFERGVDMVEAEGTMLMALAAIEALHGSSAVRMDVRYRFDPRRKFCQIQASSQVGRDLSRIFAGLLSREFGPRAFQIKRVVIKRAVA